MCGIAGAINFQLDIPLLTKDLYHRGPDEQNSFTDDNLILHHHRLSILDISGGAQPMHYEHFTIIFNGEIYNHLEVRKKLNLNCRTHSDTETILMAYEKLGADCLHEFDGMFALAIYDKQKKQLFLARDRAGKKPLYYYTNINEFVFASELNALKNQLNLSVNYDAIGQFLRYGAFHGKTSPYTNVYELPAGHFAMVDISTCSIDMKQWWSIAPFYETAQQVSEEIALSEVDRLLHISIKRRLDSSDLEVGTFLSGGIDSGLVTAIASQYRPGLKSFTVSFSGVYNEAPLARRVAEKYKTNHTELNISISNLQDDIEKILANYGEPFYDDSAIPSYYVSKEARKHLTVILNGDGSDEIFGGYRRYVPFAKYDFFSKSKVVTGLSKVIKSLVPVQHTKQSKLNYIYRLADFASQQGVETYLSATTDIFNGYYQYLEPANSDTLKAFQDQLEILKTMKLSGLKKMMLMDFNFILPDILLEKMDIASMSSSLEGRSPFLSKELMEYVPGLRDSFKIKGTTTKYLLRKLASRYLPNEIIQQPKRGFEVPLKQWVNVELKEIIFSYLQNSNSFAMNFVNKSFLRNLLDKKINLSEEKRAKMLYTLFALDVWYSKCVKNESQNG